MVNIISLDFISNHISKFGYKLKSSEYINAKSKLSFACDKGHIFSMNWNNMKTGQRCPKCHRINSRKYTKTNVEDLLKHTDFEVIDISIVKRRTYFNLLCKKHGKFSIRSDVLKVEGSICKKCDDDTKRSSIEDVILAISTIDTSLTLLTTTYVNNRQEMDILCKNHGIYKTSHSTLRKGLGACPRCNGSLNKREEVCRNIIQNLTGHIFNTVRPDFLLNVESNCCLELDGFCPELELAFEYDGEFHYLNIFGEDTLEKTKKRDRLKDVMCKKANISLIRIPYFIRTIELESFIDDQLCILGYGPILKEKQVD